MLGDGDALPQLRDAESNIHFDALPDYQGNSRFGLRLEAGLLDADCVAADREQWRVIASLRRRLPGRG